MSAAVKCKPPVIEKWPQVVSDRCESERTFFAPRSYGPGVMAARLALWCLVIALVITIAWISWVVLMSGGGFVLAICFVVLVAPWPLFYLAVQYQRRASRTDRATRNPGREIHNDSRTAYGQEN